MPAGAASGEAYPVDMRENMAEGRGKGKDAAGKGFDPLHPLHEWLVAGK
jgi:hypothetical protein